MKDKVTVEQPLRLWPGVLIVALQLLARYVLPAFYPDLLPIGVMGGLLAGLAIIVWWGFFSRAPRVERWGAVVLMILSLIATSQVLHESIATGGMGFVFPILAVPILNIAFVSWALLSRFFSESVRRVSMVTVILISCASWALVRTGGLTMNLESDFSWRWSETPEERLLAQAASEAMAPVAPTNSETEIAWQGFRGPNRDSIVSGKKIVKDWSSSPPVELWRRPVGPGWSSFAVHGNFFYTQEQRGEHEIVACYLVRTGEPVWQHRDEARFWESNGGAGPRGTPTIRNGQIFSFGGTGILNVINALDGTLLWSRNAASDAGAQLPYWGFSSSPLVLDDKIIVAASGTLVAYELSGGDPLWVSAAGGISYSSPHLLTIEGMQQIALLNGNGAISVSPADGTTLWEYAWPGEPIVQPSLTEGGDLLVNVGQGSGLRRLSVVSGPEGWSVEERWHSLGLKPFYSDVVIHNGHAFGFDGSILACIDLKDGKRRWKGGRYGAGQIFLLPEQDLILVLSEQGLLALVAASPDRFSELARFQAIESKTWNHPVLIGDVLLVRNAQEMAAFRLSLAH